MGRIADTRGKVTKTQQLCLDLQEQKLKLWHNYETGAYMMGETKVLGSTAGSAISQGMLKFNKINKHSSVIYYIVDITHPKVL